jgi:hypothetical protein
MLCCYRSDPVRLRFPIVSTLTLDEGAGANALAEATRAKAQATENFMVVVGSSVDYVTKGRLLLPPKTNEGPRQHKRSKICLRVLQLDIKPMQIQGPSGQSYVPRNELCRTLPHKDDRQGTRAIANEAAEGQENNQSNRKHTSSQTDYSN